MGLAEMPPARPSAGQCPGIHMMNTDRPGGAHVRILGAEKSYLQDDSNSWRGGVGLGVDRPVGLG